MELKFDPRQEYQIRAVESVVNLFEGHPHRLIEPQVELGGFAVVPNRLELLRNTLLSNLHRVQSQNGLKEDDELKLISEDNAGRLEGAFPNFSIEMETGTGKTYVYVRTALELHRRYGFSKFIIVVPSIAVRQGVMKTFQVTRSHFESLFDKTPYTCQVYDSAKLNQVRQFSMGNTVQFLVMTLDAFNKAGNRINQSQDSFFGAVPLFEIQATHPILILDEPQNMATDLAKKALLSLRPLFALRYSATHKEPFNLIYRLTPFEAYRQGLVKKIAVASLVKASDANRPYIRLLRVDSEGTRLTCRLSIHRRFKTGEIREASVVCRDGDELVDKTARPEYAGYRIVLISKAVGLVRFGNDVELRLGESTGGDDEAILKEQVRYTVREHFHLQSRLRSRGVKVLSLFFVDHVDSYAPEDSPIRRAFADAFDEFKGAYPEWRDLLASSVQASYFAKKRHRGGVTELIDTTGSSEADADEFRLIMEKKEQLISFEEPRAFIFSHSALKEGWDNPNVFFVCTLRPVGSELQRRQQVGRGMRIAIDQEGERVFDDGVNLLTVVANESYERYVEGLQSEIEEEYGIDGTPPPPVRANQPVARLSRERLDSPEFQALWEKIRRRTRYGIRLDKKNLLDDAVASLSRIEVSPPRISITRAELDVEPGEHLVARRAGSDVVPVGSAAPLPDLARLIGELMEFTTPPVRVTRHTLREVLSKLPSHSAALLNPQDFATAAAARLKEILAEKLVGGVHYEPLAVSEAWRMDLFEDEWREFMDSVLTPEKGLYDRVYVEGGVESQFARDLENTQEVQVFVKLPRGFTVDTPVGMYNPDWAVVWQDLDAGGRPSGRPHLYLVAETKGDSKSGRSREEQWKVECGRRHFETIAVPYYVVRSAKELAIRVSTSTRSPP